MKTLGEFLEEKGLKEEFVKEMEYNLRGVPEYFTEKRIERFLEDIYEGAIRCAIYFAETERGDEFWRQLSDEWDSISRVKPTEIDI